MSFKKIGRLICVAALSGAALTIPFMSGCNTDHPEAKITVEYEGVSYVLNYKLYRNMYPQTVQHFIELADNGFYENMIVHNYQTSSYLYTGGYSYAESDDLSYAESYSDGENGLRNYLETVSKEKEYAELAANNKLTPSVYKDYIDGKYTDALNTLIGEFSNNQHKIENGALKASYGCLRMYYSPKSDLKGRYVYLDKKGSADGVRGEYRYNSATSLFSVQLSSSTSSESNYCIFATLKNTDVLDDLKEAVTTSGTSVKLYVDNYDEYLDRYTNEVEYRMPRPPIKVTSVKITKYYL